MKNISFYKTFSKIILGLFLLMTVVFSLDEKNASAQKIPTTSKSLPPAKISSAKKQTTEKIVPKPKKAAGINSAHDPRDNDLIFQLGIPDARSAEFRLGFSNWRGEHVKNGEKVWRQIIGRTPDKQWPARHFSTREDRNLGNRYTLEIEFTALKNYNEKPLYLVIGISNSHWSEPSLLCVETNGVKSKKIRLPIVGAGRNFDLENDTGKFESVLIEIPAGAVKKGKNLLGITLEDGSWIYYDYIALREIQKPLRRLPVPPVPDLLTQFRKEGMKSVREIIFAVRKPGTDGHWYANFGYYAARENICPFHPHAGGALRVLDLETKKVRTIYEEKEGSLRDPVLHYNGKKILFSLLKKGTEHYNLYEINLDSSGLRQITFGNRDDIEPCYLPNGDIVFCSSRSNRYVQCWLTHVATVHRCGPNGENIIPLSANVEQDNTPRILSNGQIIYTRWEYVDREQVTYHHLWTMNPDGTRQMVLFGNQFKYQLFIGARQIPDSRKIVATIAPGHGLREHYGRIALIDPTLGPDNYSALQYVSKDNIHSDPWAFSENEFMAAKTKALVLLDEKGNEQPIYTLDPQEADKGYWIQEPIPVQKSAPEPIVFDNIDRSQKTGTLLLSDIYAGRKMASVPRGTVKELLVLETLPEPIHYSGGMDQISYKGTFTLERILGTVPVTPEGAAAFKIPANRSLFFIALDHEGRSVKRMHSFTSVMPGETTSCIGCHETRTEAPGIHYNKNVFAVAGKAVDPIPVEGIPDVFDFPRDIQPILDRHCVSCHNADRTEGGVDLTGDWMPIYARSYWELSCRKMLGDNRNRPMSDFPPYAIGSQASTLYQLILNKHEGVKLTESELKTIRFWLETGAPYAGTYAANGTGQIGWYYMNTNTHNDKDWPETGAMKEAITRRCDGCHIPTDLEKNLPHTMSEDREGVHQYERYLKRHDYYNLSRPEKSKILRAPLAVTAGGFGRCQQKLSDGSTAPVFKDVNDPDYKTILAGINRGRNYILYESNRFSMKPFIPNPAYIREMIRYGVLPEGQDPQKPIDPYKTDRKYWSMF